MKIKSTLKEMNPTKVDRLLSILKENVVKTKEYDNILIDRFTSQKKFIKECV
ncbi:hypothetical protein [Mycoplasma phocimorsus]|uniref:hypothetical protein n=1 Tax=Mycoplasma phocimorsus TaxID=3045839 RepID=UPI0024BFC8E4|nr:hypothetical protein [Mycoplasma phocimorsus]MDJ1646550.1 hypothetical protein [Mycoplasma phocimorsus]